MPELELVVVYTSNGPLGAEVIKGKLESAGIPALLKSEARGTFAFTIDGMGTPWRSKKFHDAYYGNLGDHRDSARACASAHAGGKEDHIGPAQCRLDVLATLLGRCLPAVGAPTRAQPFRELRP